jgi:hypothetical protein
MLCALDIPEELDAELPAGKIKALCGDGTIIPMKVGLVVVDLIPSSSQTLQPEPEVKRIKAFTPPDAVQYQPPLEPRGSDREDVPHVQTRVTSGDVKATKPMMPRYLLICGTQLL